MPMTAAERETIVRSSAADDLVYIWSAQRADITKLRKNPDAIEVGSGSFAGSPWAEFTVPASRWNPVSGIKRKVTLSAERREALASRMRSENKRESGKCELVGT